MSKVFKVKSADGIEKAVSEANLSKAEADGFYPIVTNGKEEKRVKAANLEKAKASGFVVKEDVPLTKSALGGISQGITMGFGDEILGAVEGGGNYLLDRAAHVVEGIPYEGDSLKESYQKARDERRLAYGESARQNPKTEMAGQVVGGVVGSVGAPIAGVNTLKTAAGLGAVVGLGNSDADLTDGDIVGAVKDVALGTGVGAATFGLGKGVAKTAKGVKNWLGSGEAVKNTAAKAGDFLGDLPEEVGRKIIANPSIKDMTPKGNTELAQAVEKTANRLREEMAEESGKAWKALEVVDKEVDLHLKGASIFDYPVPGFEKTVREEFAGIADDVLTTMNIKNSSQAAQKRAASYVQAAQDDFIKANNFADLKRVIQNIDKNIDWDDPSKSVANEALTKYRTYVDDLLKQINLDYRDAMVPVAKKSAMYDKLMTKFGLKNGKAGVEYTDRSVSTAKNLVDDMTKDTKSVLKGDLKEIDNALFNEFDISSIYKKSGGDTGRGSRSVVGGGLTSAALGSVFGGPGGGIAGAAVGGLAGLVRDKYGRKVASSLLASSSGAIKGGDILAQRTALAIDAAWDGLNEPTKKVLAGASERGLPALVAAWSVIQNQK